MCETMKQMGLQYVSKLEKSTAEVGRSRKKREGLFKHGLLRHECLYTSLATGIGENPRWGMQGTGSWISLLCITSGSSNACTGCGHKMVAAPSLGPHSDELVG